jgi:3-methyladenine DNA glycosylase AlkD
MSVSQIQSDLQALSDSSKATTLSRFFKTGPGEYGEGDKFLGVVVPQQRAVAKKYTDLSLPELQELLQSKIHEYRLTALFILIAQFKKADESGKKIIADFYLKNTKNINNWDLVDLSAPNILGNYFFDKDKAVLYRLANSADLWEKRMAILATYTFIKKGQLDDTLKIAEILLVDKHDLIHKAVGWMLRELGKQNQQLEEKFLQQHVKAMPRTMLRYAIEKFSPEKRQLYLKK